MAHFLKKQFVCLSCTRYVYYYSPTGASNGCCTYLIGYRGLLMIFITLLLRLLKDNINRMI